MAKNQDLAPAAARTQLAPSRMPIVSSIAKEFDVTADQWRVLVDQIFPSARSVEAIGMALAYCRARKLDIYKRPVHIVPMYSTALNRMVETVWPGIAEVRTTAHRTNDYAGIDPIKWGKDVERTFKDKREIWENRQITGTEDVEATVTFPDWAEATVYRMVAGKKRGFTAIVYWLEAYATQGKLSVPNTMWQKRPRGQLAKCAEAAALRMAFPEELGNTYVAEEMEGRTIEGAASVAAEITPAKAITNSLPEFEEPPVQVSSGGPATNPSTAPASVNQADQAGDFNDDDSGVSIERTPDELLEDIEGWFVRAKTEADIEETWSELDVEATFAHDPERMGKAIDLKAEHIARVNKPKPEPDQETLDLIDKNFPGARGS